MKIESSYYTKHKDTLIVQFPTDKYSVNECNQLFQQIKGLFPDNDILALPEDVTISVLREENPFL